MDSPRVSILLEEPGKSNQTTVLLLRGDRPQRELRGREPPGGPRRSRQWPRARLLEEPVQALPTGAGGAGLLGTCGPWLRTLRGCKGSCVSGAGLFSGRGCFRFPPDLSQPPHPAQRTWGLARLQPLPFWFRPP